MTVRAFFILSLLTVFGFGCSQNQLSERDIKRQQRQALLELKRQELTSVAGRYLGELEKENEYSQSVRLTLEVKDVPEVVEGEVDPVLIPKLVGTLRFLLGDDGGHEYIDAPVTSSDFNPQNSMLNLVANHEQFGDLIMQLKHDGKDLSGSWSAPSLGAVGTLDLEKE